MRRSILMQLFGSRSPHHNQRGIALLTIASIVFVVVSVVAIHVIQRQHRHEERTYESRHPLSFFSGSSSTTTTSGSTNNNINQIRIISFGSSSTWGAGLRQYKKEAYPYRIVPSSSSSSSSSSTVPVVRNVAMKGGNNGVLSAACTQSIVGNDDNKYDVITIEFDVFDASYDLLATRLRKRFPNANIVFVQLWNPSQLTYKYSNNDTSVDFQSWRRANGNIPLHSAELKLSILESGPPENWSISKTKTTTTATTTNQEKQDDDNDSNTTDLLHQAMERIGAGLVALPTPTSTDFAFPQNLQGFLAFFTPNEPYRLSEVGHASIAKGLRKVVNARAVIDKGIETRDTVGSWGSGDKCNLWYYNGRYDAIESTGRRLGFSHEADDDDDSVLTSTSGSSSSSASSGDSTSTERGSVQHHKHALEFRRNGFEHLTVTNPFTTDRMLYLTYMTSNDEEDQKVYPRTRVRLNDHPSVVLDPYHDFNGDHHLTRTSMVGMISPGETVVNLDPTEQSMLHFRLVGASILDEEAARILPIDFTLEPEPATVPEESSSSSFLRRVLPQF